MSGLFRAVDCHPLAALDEAPRSKLRGILRNSPKPLPSFAKATEGSPCFHPRSKLRGIRRRRITLQHIEAVRRHLGSYG